MTNTHGQRLAEGAIYTIGLTILGSALLLIYFIVIDFIIPNSEIFKTIMLGVVGLFIFMYILGFITSDLPKIIDENTDEWYTKTKKWITEW